MPWRKCSWQVLLFSGLRDEVGILESSHGFCEILSFCAGYKRRIRGTGVSQVSGTILGSVCARGAIRGLPEVQKYSSGCTAESLAYQVHDVLETMEEGLRIDLSALRADGGASANNHFLSSSRLTFSTLR